MKFNQDYIDAIETCLDRGTVIIKCDDLKFAIVSNTGDREMRNENHLLRSGLIVMIWSENTRNDLERILTLINRDTTMLFYHNNYCGYDVYLASEPYRLINIGAHHEK